MTSPPHNVQPFSGPAEAWNRQRDACRKLRRTYTDTLKAHGATGQDYGACTNTLYVGLFRKTADSLRKEKGLGPRQNLRDAMDFGELSLTGTGEWLAAERIEQQQCADGEACRMATFRTASFLRNAVEAERKDRARPVSPAANDQRAGRTAA